MSLLKLLPLQLAAKDGSAVPVYPIGEVLTGNADLLPFPIGQLSLFDELPLLHGCLAWYVCATAGGTPLARTEGLRPLIFSNAWTPLLGLIRMS